MRKVVASMVLASALTGGSTALGQQTAPPPAPPSAPRAMEPPPPPSWPPRSGVPIRFESVPQGGTFYVRSRELAGVYWSRRRARRAWLYHYAPLCAAPCALSLPPGTYQLSMSSPDDDGVADTRVPLRLTQPTTIQGEYVSHRGLRTVGWATLVAGMGTGIYFLVAGLSGHTPTGCTVNCRSEVNTGEVLGGVGLLVGGAIVGAVLIGTPDEARLTVVTGSGAARAPGVSLAGAF